MANQPSLQSMTDRFKLKEISTKNDFNQRKETSSLTNFPTGNPNQISGPNSMRPERQSNQQQSMVQGNVNCPDLNQNPTDRLPSTISSQPTLNNAPSTSYDITLPDYQGKQYKIYADAQLLLRDKVGKAIDHNEVGWAIPVDEEPDSNEGKNMVPFLKRDFRCVFPDEDELRKIFAGKRVVKQKMETRNDGKKVPKKPFSLQSISKENKPEKKELLEQKNQIAPNKIPLGNQLSVFLDAYKDQNERNKDLEKENQELQKKQLEKLENKVEQLQKQNEKQTEEITKMKDDRIQKLEHDLAQSQKQNEELTKQLNRNRFIQKQVPLRPSNRPYSTERTFHQRDERPFHPREERIFDWDSYIPERDSYSNKRPKHN